MAENVVKLGKMNDGEKEKIEFIKMKTNELIQSLQIIVSKGETELDKELNKLIKLSQDSYLEISKKIIIAYATKHSYDETKRKSIN